MKANYEKKDKKGSVKGSIDLDAERIIEKGMDLHEKNWKDKFEKKHIAKKEILEIKHKQKMEDIEQKRDKKNWLQIIAEEKRKIRELELEDRRIREEKEIIEKRRILKIKLISSVILGILAMVLFVVGSVLGEASGNSDSAWHLLSILGLFPLLAIPYIWISEIESKKRKHK